MTWAPTVNLSRIESGGAAIGEVTAEHGRRMDGDVADGANLVSDGDNVEPSGSEVRDIHLSAPGTYELMCNIHDHFMAGMTQAITVT